MDSEEKKPALFNFLSKLGLEEFYPNKLTLRSLLEINKSSVYDEAVSSVEEIPWCFLRRLFRINAECRDCTQLSNTDNDEEDNDEDFDKDLFSADDSADNKVNPLDLIVALFLCADSFLQQEMALKMSMCQFSVPLLLPHGNNSQCTFMLWALRDIVKEWRPHDISESKGFVENSIVQADIPFYSFVRLKNCSLSKSQCLNHILSLGQYNNMFINREMKGGAHERELANGLVEVCWYLPSGRENLDKFPKPVAFANLRGDLTQSLTQFSFLHQVSTATFVFLDKVEENELEILTSFQEVKSKLFLVVNRKDQEDMESVKKTVEQLDLPKTRVKSKTPQENVVEFSEKLCTTITNSLKEVKTTTNIENMLDQAVELGLSVDECTSENQKRVAVEIMKGIGVCHIPDYKKQQLPLQGADWKKLSNLEMEECRLKKAGDCGLEDYKSQLQEDKQEIMNKLHEHKPSTAMNTFIKQISEHDKMQRYFFLKWMNLKLNAHLQPAMQQSLLRQKLAKDCNKEEKDKKQIAELDQALLESSLGIEHYMREMGLIYELSSQSQQTDDMITRLPGLAAEMLLDGYPLELLDGDASNISQRWVTDVLMELHNKVGGKSRLLVLTVLGVQSTGKSTLLNTMFGVQFPVSSGRCTRGAYMLFLRVGEDMQSMLNYDFIVLIDTEGLRSPSLAQLEDSFEYDYQLATLVIGLSDVTIINVAMENFTEMKDFLQIATHAFLRMKKVGKRPVCHFVHQNVAGVSAHAKTLTERKLLLDQLNEMTQIAAYMEEQDNVLFTDVMDYDLEKNNWYIPGLWHGTPPMAPVNTGYSEAVEHFKRNLLETVKTDKGDDVSKIPELLEWMRSLWRAVKFENFIFSFRNTLVANAYDNLCKEFNQWEWEFRKEISIWEKAAEMEILNADNESELHHLKEMLKSKKSEGSKTIADQQKRMHQKLLDYYKRKDRHVNLIEKNKSDFFNQIKSLAKEIQHSANNVLDCAREQKKSSKEAEDLQRKHREVIEVQVMKLLSDCKDRSLSEEELEEEFEKMWAEVTINVTGLKERDIPAEVFDQLKKHFLNLNVSEELQNITDLKESGLGQFKAKTEHFETNFLNNVLNFIMQKNMKRELQGLADNVIESCTRFVQDIAKTDRDYHKSDTKDLLEKIDESLKKGQQILKQKFVTDLKLHVCGIASRYFLQMHRKYLIKRDPKLKLEEKKKQYMSDCIDLYKERDHFQRKATDYVRSCIKPAVEDYISRSLGVEIVDEILTSGHSAEFSSRSFFQYNIQEELLGKEDFDRFVRFTCSYEMYVKDWIFKHVLQKMSEDQTLCKLKNKVLQVIVDKISEALKQSTKCTDGTSLPDNKESIPALITNIRRYLIKDISISEEDEKTTLFQVQCTSQQFINSLKISLEDLNKELQEEFTKSNISETLQKLPTKPQDELFKRVFGCGHQCPFCKVPCEAGGKDHEKHHAAVHRPQGLAAYRDEETEKLVETLCTTDVHSEHQFRNADTKWKAHLYKEYTKYYPNWHIPPDRTIMASDYWKYVLVTYNDRFAEKYEAKPADVPKAWRRITKEQALKSLKEAFNVK
ncbi:up-regulator of cell proliferation-like [Notolabrus celidotus]|uniref:up-regulator of cell proliferation-like n=1 Tax=Notolabrus celidotus TaxID=1203425 RepID=UPI0014906369|nr:up-regulator of cell proliferation-like [Notolabrus celidotus]